jgi:hypothetical protein
VRLIDDLEESEKGPRWDYVAALEGRDPGFPLADFTYTRVNDDELCGDAIVRLETGEPLVVREYASFGDPGLYGLFALKTPDSSEPLVRRFMQEAGIPPSSLLQFRGPAPEYSLQRVREKTVSDGDDDSVPRPLVLPPRS